MTTETEATMKANRNAPFHRRSREDLNCDIKHKSAYDQESVNKKGVRHECFTLRMILPILIIVLSFGSLYSRTISITLLLILCCFCTRIYGSETSELIKLSTCSLELSACPMDTDSVEIRTICMNNFSGCPRDTAYLCGVDAMNKYLIESCQTDLKCQPGTSFQYIVDAEQLQVHLECLPCTGNRFEPEHTRSSLCSVIPGCTYRHLPPEQLSSNLLLYEMGTKSTATKWVCNYEKGFYERDGRMFCNDVPTHTYECIYKTCLAGYLLRPDGVCVQCSTKLIPEKDFICYAPLWKNANSLPNINQIPRIQASTARTHRNALKIANPDKGDGDGESETKFPTGIIVAIVIVGVVASGLACFMFLYWRRRRRATGYNAAYNQEDPPEYSSNNNHDEAQQSTQKPTNTTTESSQHINNSQIGNNFQARDIQIDHLEYHNHIHNGNVNNMGDGTTPKTTTSASSATVEEEESQQKHLRMNHLKLNSAEEGEDQTDPKTLKMNHLTLTPKLNNK